MLRMAATRDKLAEKVPLPEPGDDDSKPQTIGPIDPKPLQSR